MSPQPPYPDEQPTTRLPTAAPVQARVPLDAPVAGAPVAGAPLVDAVSFERLADAVGRLRTAVTLVGLLSVIALALAGYALHEAQKDDGGRGVSSSRVARIDARIDRLKAQVQAARAGNSGSTASGADLSALQSQVAGAAKASDVQALKTAVAKLQAAPAGGGGTDQTAAVTALSDRVDKLSAQVQTLQQSGQTTTP
ncbi:MAG: hypothetical protein JWM31_2674 [Solirubrobacterales bacterium]|nr:hypothetical protein [Solirubrobacterales bacterium]